ncbi:aldehyde dehydrogenase [Streptomyces pristinaespiralis]|uniref:Aldehyde dehydrogenase n=1 Tax=Streptomyces pristinaespiralis TaxID=38300 RepID=A0A0M4DG93_STRPR|nr:aldehyde dehydrogenase [Streptomyces pristinaespiralis]ALC24865.1 aldehyde dehydrogenase [Streptomyces pristinaespiralis]QMU12840.1 aldehyde dehydrogenase [Streptomyces pristinaespiralis]
MPTVPTDILIAGQWRRGAGEPLDTVDPATGRVLATVGSPSAEEVSEAAEAAARAAAEPAWRDLLPHERARLLHRIGDLVERDADELSALQTADTGKTLAETRALALSAAGTFRYLAAALETAEDTLTPSRGPYVTMSVHEPIGVVGAINPWNSPVASDAQKLAPALAAGNAVLLKPAAWTPLVSLALGRLITRALEEFRLPTALLSVLPGSGRLVGDAIVRHPLVARIGFTGGTATGRSIAAVAAQKLIPASLELGGKSPTIVRADADVEQALAGVMFGIFSSSGQSCIAGSRLFVARDIHDRFVGELVERVRALRVGPGTDPTTQVGPLVHHRHRDAVAAYVDLARSEGARVLCGGSAPEGERYRDGAYYLPTVLDGLPNTSRTCQEEIFGPVLVALPYDDEDDLVRQANDSVYGLACGIWTRDARAAWHLARRIEAGTVWINTYKQFSASTPFSGWKDSGLGTEKGRDAIRAYQRQKSLYWGTSASPLPWAN